MTKQSNIDFKEQDFKDEWSGTYRVVSIESLAYEEWLVRMQAMMACEDL